MKMWHASSLIRPQIEEIEVDRVTDSYVWYDGRRHGRMTEFDCYFETREEAVNYLIKQMKDQINRHRMNIEKIEDRLTEFVLTYVDV